MPVHSSRVGASSVDAHLTFEKFLSPDALPETFRQAVARIDYSSASAKINLALAEPPQFSCVDGNGVGPHHHERVAQVRLHRAQGARADVEQGVDAALRSRRITIGIRVLDPSIVGHVNHQRIVRNTFVVELL